MERCSTPANRLLGSGSGMHLCTGLCCLAWMKTLRLMLVLSPMPWCGTDMPCFPRVLPTFKGVLKQTNLLIIVGDLFVLC